MLLCIAKFAVANQAAGERVKLTVDQDQINC